MSTRSLERVVELWPNLSEEAQQSIVEIAETTLPSHQRRALTPYEERMVEQSIEDFKHGRVLDAEAYRKRMDEFMRGLAAKGPK